MPQFLVSSGLPSYPAGLSDEDAGLVLPLYRSVNGLAQLLSEATGQVQYSPGEMAQVDQFTKLLDARYNKILVKAGADLAYGKMVTLSISSGKIIANLADASILTSPAHGIVDTPTGIANGEYGEIIFMRGKSGGVSGTTFGTTYYLSTSGNVTSTPPVATGVLHQVVGMGLGTVGLYLNIALNSRVPSYVYKYSATVLRTLYADGSYTDSNV